MRIAVGMLGVAALAVCVWRFAGSWALVPYLGFAAVSTVLADIDLRTHRLPNRIVLPAVGAAVLLLLGASFADGEFGRWPGALIGSAALFGFYLVLALISPAGMGMGDVKLAALVGLFAGYLGFAAWLLAVVAGFFLGAVAALGAIVLRRADRGTRIPFGPWMLAGAWVAIAIGPAGLDPLG